MGDRHEIYAAVGASCFAEVEEGLFGEGAAAVAEEGKDCGLALERDFGCLGRFGSYGWRVIGLWAGWGEPGG